MVSNWVKVYIGAFLYQYTPSNLVTRSTSTIKGPTKCRNASTGSEASLIFKKLKACWQLLSAVDPGVMN